MTIHPSEADAIALAIKTFRPIPAGLAAKLVDFAANLGLEVGALQAECRSVQARLDQAQERAERMTGEANRLRDRVAELELEAEECSLETQRLGDGFEHWRAQAQDERRATVAFLECFGSHPNGRTVDAIDRAAAAISRGDHLRRLENQGSGNE